MAVYVNGLSEYATYFSHVTPVPYLLTPESAMLFLKSIEKCHQLYFMHFAVNLRDVNLFEGGVHSEEWNCNKTLRYL